MTEAPAPAAMHELPALPPIAMEPPAPAGLLASFLFGFRMARYRLYRRRTALLGLLAIALAASSAAIERRFGSAGAVDRALESTFRLIIPLATFAIVAEVSAHARLREAAWPAARYGARHRDVLLGMIAATVAASALFGAVLAALSVAVAHTPSAPPLVSDALLSAWIGAITALAYAGWFVLGATFMRLGRGRFVPLIADFVIGASGGMAGAILPRGNALSLLGGEAPLRLPQQASTGILIVSGAVLCGLAVLRCRK
jgi:hypothetical protein